MKAAVLDGVPGLPGIVGVSFYDPKPFHFSQCVATQLNGFSKNGKCMTPIHKWYVTLTFCV